MEVNWFSIFETPIGPCGIAWGEHGLKGVQLPETDEARTRARMRRRFPGAPKVAPPPGVRAAADCILALPHGARDDLRDVALDMSAAPPFERRAYECVRAIAPGATLIYGEVAARLGEPGAGRAVGQALGRNPFVAVVPWYRVLAADGRAGGFSAQGAVATKLRMLQIERARIGAERGLFEA